MVKRTLLGALGAIAGCLAESSRRISCHESPFGAVVFARIPAPCAKGGE